MRTGALNKLTAQQVKAAGVGMHSDGGGLFLRVKGSTRSWVFRFTSGGRKREMGLGAAAAVSLAEARSRAAGARAMVGRGLDPVEERHRPAAAPVASLRASVPTFRTASVRHLQDHGRSWRNPKHRQQWHNTLDTWAAPLMEFPVDLITAGDVADCLSQIWLEKPVTARRVRGRIERILGACIARGERQSPNPAALRDNLDHILPRQNGFLVRHHAAVPVAHASEAFRAIRAKRGEGEGYRALITLCLTALRSGEVRHMQWGDLVGGVIVIPAERMKAGRPHDVPVSGPLAEHFAEQPRWAETELIHPGNHSRPLSDMTLAMAMRRVGLGDWTPHGWRSTFRDWAGANGWERELAELQLAHQVGSKVERAYARATLLERRRPMMEAWARFLVGAA